MFCGKCGARLEEGAKFCHLCGYTVGEEGAEQAVLPVQQKRKKNKFLIPAAAGVAVLALLAVLAVTLLGNPAARLGKAMAKSAGAYAAAAEGLDLPDLTAMAAKQEYNMEMALWLEELPGMEEASGLGIRMTAGSSLPQRQMDMTIAPCLGAADLLSIRMKAEDEKLYFSGGALTGDTFYMLNTETMGQDLANLGMTGTGLEDLSYNIFDLAEEISGFSAGDEQEMAAAITAAAADFWEKVTVEKAGTQTMTVNGCDLQCTAYRVLVPQTASQALVDDLEEIFAAHSQEQKSAYLEIFSGMGLGEDLLDAMGAGMDESQTAYTEAFGKASQVVTQLGDVEIQMYVNGGYLVAAVCQEELEGSQVRVTLELGGVANYADDLCVRVEVDGEELRVTSTGSHTGDGGRFTDETVAEIIREGEIETVLTSSLSYEPQAPADNFHYNLYVASDDATLDVRGQVEMAEDSIHIRLDELALTDYGKELMTLGVEYKVGPYAPADMDTTGAVALGTLTQEELTQELDAIEGYATEWLFGLLEQFPELLYLLY